MKITFVFFTRWIDGSKYYISSNKNKKNPDFFLLITNQNFMLAPPYIYLGRGSLSLGIYTIEFTRGISIGLMVCIVKASSIVRITIYEWRSFYTTVLPNFWAQLIVDPPRYWFFPHPISCMTTHFHSFLYDHPYERKKNQKG
jgi:hypothetical protein